MGVSIMTALRMVRHGIIRARQLCRGRAVGDQGGGLGRVSRTEALAAPANIGPLGMCELVNIALKETCLSCQKVRASECRWQCPKKAVYGNDLHPISG
jgi:hypothetical protein